MQYPLPESIEMLINQRISIDPNICHGKPCVANHRVPIYMVLELIAQGIDFDEIVSAYYPSLTREDISACVIHPPRSRESLS